MKSKTPEPLLEYNTQRNKMKISEYGRNIQKMIEHACSLEDKEERNKAAKSIVKVMGQLNPHLRDVTDFNHKLWDHLFIMSNFELDVESPYPKPAPETFTAKPEKVSYPSNRIKYRHFGKSIEKIIEEAKKMEDGPKKDHLVGVIANFMKMSYLNYNRDSVSDELILEFLDELSDGKLKPGENFRFYHTNEILQSTRKPKQQQKGKGVRSNFKDRRRK
jgi:hypothetical protein